MTRAEYKTVLLKNGFLFDHSQRGFPGRGEEDVYTHPDYKYKFYVTRIDKDNENIYGFLTTKTNGEILDNVYSSNAEDTYESNKTLFVWRDEAFEALMKRLPNA